MRILVASLLLAIPAHAQQQCAPLPDALAGLAKNHQEQVAAQGLSATGDLMVITASAKGGWSVLIVKPDGTACMAAFGEGFELIDPEPAGVDG